MEKNIALGSNATNSEHLLKLEPDFGDAEVASTSGKQLYFHSDFSFLDSDEELESKSTKVLNFIINILFFNGNFFVTIRVSFVLNIIS